MNEPIDFNMGPNDHDDDQNRLYVSLSFLLNIDRVSRSIKFDSNAEVIGRVSYNSEWIAYALRHWYCFNIVDIIDIYRTLTLADWYMMMT